MTELAIRTRRAAFNTAIANRDASAIGAFLVPDCVMVTGSDSVAVSGKAEQVKVWRTLFKSGDKAHYVRTPEIITLSQVEPIAMEHGRWTGVLEGGAVQTGGSYAAKWRKIDEEWLIVAEIYVTLD